MTKRLLVQFFHPGPEFDRAVDRADWTDQNQPHRRKFMQVRGRRAEGNGSIGDDLAIWGEWEPQAECVQTLKGLGVGLPKRLWRPYYDLSTAPPNRLNTDPLVFGGFRYTVCQQHRRYKSGWRRRTGCTDLLKPESYSSLCRRLLHKEWPVLCPHMAAASRGGDS